MTTWRNYKPVARKDGMNKTEAAYAAYLELLKKAGEVVAYRYEPCALKLAPKTTYTPDFLVIYPGHMEFHEVKGFERDDAIVKFKVAAEMFPWFGFKMVKKVKGGFAVTREV